MTDRECQDLLSNNRDWARRMRAADPEFFTRLGHVQRPRHLWIGCADSRVPANQIVDLPPGEMFVHRNVANLVVPSDLNCLSVMQYAVDVLEVRHIIVCGHYGCGGVAAALAGDRVGLVDNWLSHVRDLRIRHSAELALLDRQQVRWDRLGELNVIEQVRNVCQTTVVRDAWARDQALAVHGWIYGVSDGRINDLGVTIDAKDDIEPIYARGVQRVVQAMTRSTV
jgi:carbonic anhydrase